MTRVYLIAFIGFVLYSLATVTPHQCDNQLFYCWSGPLNTNTLLGAGISYLNRH